MGEALSSTPHYPMERKSKERGMYMQNVEWHPVCLPSMGVYYNGACPGGKVTITPWTMVQEEMMVRYSERDPGLIMDQLIANNVKLPDGLKYEDLLVTDQWFLVINLRAISLVQFLTVTHTCPQCGNLDEQQINLLNLTVRVPDPGDQEPIECRLPKCKKTVGLRFLRVRDIAKSNEYGSSHPNDAGDPVYRFRLARKIVSVNGQSVKFEEAIDFVKSLVMIDVISIQKALEKKETGYVTNLDAVCTKCRFVEKGWVLPLHQSHFFRPLDSDIAAESGLVGGDGQG